MYVYIIIIHVLCCSGVEPWTFVQKLGDAVFIPVGCPHQVRNIKVSYFSFLYVLFYKIASTLLGQWALVKYP